MTESSGPNFYTDVSALVIANERVPMILLGPGEPEQYHQPNQYFRIENSKD